MKRKILSVLLGVVILTTACGIEKKNKTELDIKIGTGREQVIDALGMPQKQLVDFKTDVYYINGETVLIHYKLETDEAGDEIMTVREIKLSDVNSSDGSSKSD